MIHEILQEHASVVDPLADIEAFQDEGDDDDVVAGDKGKKIVEDDDAEAGDTEKLSSAELDSDDDDSSDDDDEDGQRPKIVQFGSRMMVMGESASGKEERG